MQAVGHDALVRLPALSGDELEQRARLATAEEQVARRNRGEPLTHRLVRLPAVSRRTRRLLGPLQGLVVDG